MRNRILPLALAAAACFPLAAQATTWDEPWHDEVVRKSSSFGLYQVVSVDGNKAKVKLLRHLAGESTPVEVVLADYGLLRQTSSHSGAHDDEKDPWLEAGKTYYLYLMQDALAGNWQLASPSAGSAKVREGDVVEATYRISMHQSLVPKAPYELTQVCMYQSLHGKDCDAKAKEFVDATLGLPVAELSRTASEDEQKRFFLQHAALETAATAHLPISEATLARFGKSHFFHIEISTLRYLSTSTLPDRWHRIATFACDGGRHEFSRRFALLLLENGKAKAEAATLRACVKQAPTEYEGMLVDSIRDPRVGTHYPENVKKVMEELLADLGK